MKYKKIQAKLKSHSPSVLTDEHNLVSSVILPLTEIDGELHILLEVRSPKLRSQPCDVSFPGGKIDASDKSPRDAAIRETCEELGLRREDIEIFAELDLLTTPYGVIIHNFVGKINDISKIQLNKEEVHSVFHVPLSFFISNEPIVYTNEVELIRSPDFPFHLIPFGKDYPFKRGFVNTYFWQYDGKTIWGMTASIIKNFIQLIS